MDFGSATSVYETEAKITLRKEEAERQVSLSCAYLQQYLTRIHRQTQSAGIEYATSGLR